MSSIQLQSYASELGSDCPFFIENKPAYLFGKGHELELFDLNLSGLYMVLVNTGAHSNTALAYKYAQRREVFNESSSLKKLIKKPISTWKKNIINDFEPSVFESLPELSQVKDWLYNHGAVYASMSGSGASMFGLFITKPKLTGKWVKHVVFESIL